MAGLDTWTARGERAPRGPERRRGWLSVILAAGMLASGPAVASSPVEVLDVQGSVQARAPKARDYRAVRAGARIAHGARLKTGEDAQAVLRFADGTKTRVHENSEVVVRAPGPSTGRPNGVVLFFGRLWTNVVKSVSGEETFEVRSANAVAGVRGTEFEVGVGVDGATRVVVREGQVDVGGDRGDEVVRVAPGQEVRSDIRGRLGARRKAPDSLDWEGWFSEHAAQLVKHGQAAAKNMHGRLDARKAKVEQLVAEQRRLKQQIDALEARRAQGADVTAQLQEKLRELRGVTARLEDMQRRLQAVFGLFALWAQKAEEGAMEGSEQVALLAADVKRVEKGFADLFEEGTDLSEESLDDMMKDMQKGPTLKPKKKAKDELF